MIDFNELYVLLESGAIETYKGDLDVIVDKPHGVAVISQGERMLVLTIQQVSDLIKMLIYKVGERY